MIEFSPICPTSSFFAFTRQFIDFRKSLPINPVSMVAILLIMVVQTDESPHKSIAVQRFIITNFAVVIKFVIIRNFCAMVYMVL